MITYPSRPTSSPLSLEVPLMLLGCCPLKSLLHPSAPTSHLPPLVPAPGVLSWLSSCPSNSSICPALRPRPASVPAHTGLLCLHLLSIHPGLLSLPRMADTSAPKASSLSLWPPPCWLLSFPQSLSLSLPVSPLSSPSPL